MLKPISKLFTTILFLCFVSASVFAQMSGTYTIDKTKTGTTNFKTFKGAVNALNSSGVSGPVLFKVANGTYTEQVSFLYVSGSSTTNTITFQGSDSSKVVLQYDCSQYESVIKINAAANFVFEGMTIKSTNNTYGYGVHITSSAENITVKNCIVSVASRTGVSVDCIPINIAGGTYATYGENGENVTIKNSILSGGYFGINIRGTNNSLLSETFNIENNELTGQYVYPIYAVYAKDINILNNSIDNTILYYAYGVYTNQCAGGEISYNKIYAGRFGLYLYLHNYYNRADSIVVSNNEISDFDDASYQSGIYSSSTFNLKAYHNTISTNGTVSNFAYSAMYVNAPYNHSILNNNLKASGNSAVFFLGSGSLGSTKVDYNNYSVGANGSLISWQGTTYNSINDLKNAVSSQNQNSTSEDPLFSSSRNLVPQAPGINNRALNGLSSIDLNGNSRPKAPDAIADIGAYEYYVTPNDIDLITVSDPLIAKTGNNDVGVIIKNNGSSTYKDTVFLQYKIDNGSWVKDTAIYSNFLIGTVDTFFFSKKWNISGSGTFNVCVSILPGITGDPDSLVGDTICETKCVGRSGTFTIDATGNGDYRTFNAAINSLSCGIAGPITFEVEPGTYNERLTLEPVLGASAQNTITFEGTDKDKVIIDYDGTSSLPATVLFDDADYVTFKNVTIVNEGNQVACGFWLRESANFNTIENCNIKLDSTTAGYSLTGILVANSTSSSSTTIPGNASENLEFKNNLIVGGSHGIRINGTGYNTTSENILIQNNTIRNFYFQGLNAIYISSSKIRKNHISKPRTTTAYGIIMYYNHNDSIDGNYVEGGRYGMYIYYENTYNRNTFSSIANNMVTNLRDPNYQVGIFTYSGYNLSIYHNSVWTNGTYSNPFYAAMNMYYCYNSFAKNNSLKAGEGMIFAKYYGNISIGAIDYNNYYGTGAAKYYYDGLTFTDLSTWQSIKSKFNQSSKEGDPNYNSITDLHVTGAQLNNAALKGLGITTDFDGDKRPFSPDKKVDIGADEYYVSPYDIDLVSLDSPIVPIIGNNDIKIILRNTGIQSIDDDTIVVSYSIDGTLQVRDTVIINSLAPNNNYTYTFSKQWSISTGKTYQLCAQLDTFFKPDPDSLNIQKKCMNMCPGARGSYTIDASGNGDFKTFRGALNALSCGINGAVTFNVKNGIYREHIHLNEVLGASANNSITFKGESKNGVIVRYQGTVDTHQTVHLEGADYFHLENMTIANTSSVYSKGVRISNTADYNTFTNIKFNLPANALGGNCMSVQISDEGLNTIGNAGNYNVFEKCSFENGYYGVRLFGIGTTSLIYGNEFIDCSFRNHRVFGIYGYYQGQLNVENCSFDSLQLDYYQLYLYMCSQSSIIGNNIKDGKYGLRLLYENYYFQEETSEIVNNMASGQNSANGENYSMDIYYCYNVKFFHNSLMMSTGSSGSVARFYYGSGHDVRNNSFSKTSNADLITNTSTSFSEVDFNNYYIGSSNNFVNFNGAGYDDLAKWQSAVSGFNRNSKEGDPGYNSASDLTIDPKTNQLANWGSITTGITNDFEGDIRNPQSPDIGADEFSDLYDIGVTALQNPTTACNLSNTEEITIQVKNLGNIVVPSGELLPVAYKIGTNSDVVDTFILTSNFAKGDSLNFTFKTKADFSAHKTYSLSAWTNIANDSLRSNDTLSTNLSSYEIPQADFNYSTTACSNEDIEFTDNSSANTATISSYNWNFGNGITTNTKNSKVAYSVDGSYSVKLVIESNNGCKDSIIKSIDVNEKPTAAFTSTNLCFGDSATFANTSSIATATGAVFNWDFDDNTTTSKRTPKHKFSSTKNYNVELIATSANGCKDTVVNTVSISPNPVASFSFSNECKGDTNYFTNTSNVPNGYNPSYSWKFGDGNGASTENTKYVYGAIGNYTVELTAQLSNGCSSTAQNSIDIFSKPQPQFSVANGCSGDSIAFTNASTIKLDTIKTHSWAFGDGNSSIKTNPKNLYNNNGSYDVKLILTSVKGCVDSISKSLDIYEKPTAAYTVSAACSNDSAEFNNSSSITNGSISGQIWNFGDGFSSTASDPKHKYAAHGSYNTSLIVESNNGCTDTATAQATVNPSPVANFTAPNVCFGSKLFLSNKSTVATGLLWKYNWDFGDGNTSTQLNPVHTYTTKDTFTIKLISESDKSCKDSIERDVIVDSKIIPDFSFDSLCFGDSTAFKNQTNTSCGSVTGFFWDFGDGDTSRGFSPTHKYASAGTYNVKLIVYQGIAKDSVNKQVTINSIPNAVFNANNACQNEDVSFSNNSNISTGSITNYSWNFGDGAKSTATAPKHAYSSNGTYQAYLVATGTGGCTDTATKSISVYELPSTNFSVSNACLGSSVNFSNSSSITSGTLSYSWQFGDGFSSTQKSPSYNYANSGNYTVKLSAESNNGCTTIDSQSVTIHPKPSANFSANNQCSNQSISFNNSSSISTGTISYLWKFGDNTTSTAINPKHQYASPGTYSVTLVVTSNNNCVDSVTKTVNALPTPIANFTVPSPCSGTKITFANASTVPSGTMNHVWNFGDGNSSSTTSPTHTYSSTGTYQVKLVSTSTSGCKDSITKTVNVYDIPTASFSVNGKCLSDSIAFGNTSTIGAGSMTYSWSLGDGTTSSKTSINHKYANSGTYQVKLVATSNGGCKDSSTQTINITPTPIAAFTANNVCLGESTSFSNSSSISSGTISYFWDFDNGLASTQENPSIKFTNSGSYNVELIATSNNGCSDTATNQVDVFVNPKASFSFANKCLDDTTIFTNNSTITTGTLNFAWDFDDGNNSLNRNPKHRFGATGSYLVELIAISNNACTDTIFKQININPKAIPAFATSNACFGETVDFKNNSSLSSGTYSNSWAFGDGNTSSAINAQNLYAQAGTYITKLTLTTDSGCVSSQTKAVIINNKPTASFSTANVCQNKTALFTNASSINSGKISAYFWSFGDGFGSNSNAPNHQYTSSGSYNVELIASSDSGCTDTANQNISIYPTPTTAFTVTNICFGDTLYPSNNSTIKTGSISSYNWNFSDGNSATSTNPFNYYTSKGTYNVKLVTTSNNGCKDSLIKQTVVDNVIVPGFTFSNVCLGQKAAFTNTTNASCGNISSYQWAFGDGSISSQQNPDYTYKTAGTFNVRLIVTQKSGGRDTLIQQITVNPNPTVSISVNDTCAGISPTFINNSSISGGSI
ncbi:MAG: PKD domain-containing protein, partial [Bacteroidia bacterium]